MFLKFFNKKALFAIIVKNYAKIKFILLSAIKNL